MSDRYRKRPVTIHALQWTGQETDLPAARAFLGPDLVGTEGHPDGWSLLIRTLENPVAPFTAPPSWWLLRGVRGERYACEPGIFAETYDRVTPEEHLRAAVDAVNKAAPAYALRVVRAVVQEIDAVEAEWRGTDHATVPGVPAVLARLRGVIDREPT